MIAKELLEVTEALELSQAKRKPIHVDVLLNFMSQQSFWRKMPSYLHQEMAAELTIKRFSTRTVLERAGNPAAGAYVVITGSVCVYGLRQPELNDLELIRTALARGVRLHSQCWGGQGLTDGSPYLATYFSLTDLCCVFLPFEAYNRVFQTIAQTRATAFSKFLSAQTTFRLNTWPSASLDLLSRHVIECTYEAGAVVVTGFNKFSSQHDSSKKKPVEKSGLREQFPRIFGIVMSGTIALMQPYDPLDLVAATPRSIRPVLGGLGEADKKQAPPTESYKELLHHNKSSSTTAYHPNIRLWSKVRNDIATYEAGPRKPWILEVASRGHHVGPLPAPEQPRVAAVWVALEPVTCLCLPEASLLALCDSASPSAPLPEGADVLKAMQQDLMIAEIRRHVIAKPFFGASQARGAAEAQLLVSCYLDFLCRESQDPASGPFDTVAAALQVRRLKDVHFLGHPLRQLGTFDPDEIAAYRQLTATRSRVPLPSAGELGEAVAAASAGDGKCTRADAAPGTVGADTRDVTGLRFEEAYAPAELPAEAVSLQPATPVGSPALFEAVLLLPRALLRSFCASMSVEAVPHAAHELFRERSQLPCFYLILQGEVALLEVQRTNAKANKLPARWPASRAEDAKAKAEPAQEASLCLAHVKRGQLVGDLPCLLGVPAPFAAVSLGPCMLARFPVSATHTHMSFTLSFFFRSLASISIGIVSLPLQPSCVAAFLEAAMPAAYFALTFLQRHPIFSSTPLHTLLRLAVCCQLRDFSAPRAITQQGRVSPGLFVLLEGRVDVSQSISVSLQPQENLSLAAAALCRVRVRPVPVATLGALEMFGEACLLARAEAAQLLAADPDPGDAPEALGSFARAAGQGGCVEEEGEEAAASPGEVRESCSVVAATRGRLLFFPREQLRALLGRASQASAAGPDPSPAKPTAPVAPIPQWSSAARQRQGLGVSGDQGEAEPAIRVNHSLPLPGPSDARGKLLAAWARKQRHRRARVARFRARTLTAEALALQPGLSLRLQLAGEDVGAAAPRPGPALHEAWVTDQLLQAGIWGRCRWRVGLGMFAWTFAWAFAGAFAWACAAGCVLLPRRVARFAGRAPAVA